MTSQGRFSLSPGISKASAVKLTEPITVFMADLRSRLPSSIPLLLTSGYRDPAAQAMAMANKVKLGESLRKLYADDFADAVMGAYPDIGEMASVIASFAVRGRGSRHLTGQAVDLRSYTMTSAQIQQVLSAARDLGGKAIYEDTPAHIHIEVPVGYKGTSPVSPDFPTGAFVDKDGPGGWRYRQWPDGTILIIGAPPGHSAGAMLLPGTGSNDAVTAEIGAYRPPMQLATFPWPVVVLGSLAAAGALLMNWRKP